MNIQVFAYLNLNLYSTLWLTTLAAPCAKVSNETWDPMPEANITGEPAAADSEYDFLYIYIEGNRLGTQ